MEQVVEIVGVEVIGDYAVRVTFGDGVVRDVDLSSPIGGPQGEPLRNPEFFANVSVGPKSATIVWPNGAHLHSDFLHPHERELPRGPKREP